MKKMIKAIVIIFIFAILLFPDVSYCKDGGTVTYDAVLYSVRKEHSMANQMVIMWEQKSEYFFGKFTMMLNILLINRMQKIILV